MSIRTVLLPLFVQVLLTFGLLFWLAALRVSALRSGVVRGGDVALREPNWPHRHLQVQCAFQNQLELPVLFYLLTILAVITRSADLVFVVLAWVFVLSRLAHAYVHVTDNDLGRRGQVFGLGALVLLIMWIVFMIRILVAL
jgi:hypothetical protein